MGRNPGAWTWPISRYVDFSRVFRHVSATCRTHRQVIAVSAHRYPVANAKWSFYVCQVVDCYGFSYFIANRGGFKGKAFHILKEQKLEELCTVSYTQLTLPTKRSVLISGAAVTLQK